MLCCIISRDQTVNEGTSFLFLFFSNCRYFSWQTSTHPSRSNKCRGTTEAMTSRFLPRGGNTTSGCSQTIAAAHCGLTDTSLCLFRVPHHPRLWGTVLGLALKPSNPKKLLSLEKIRKIGHSAWWLLNKIPSLTRCQSQVLDKYYFMFLI